MEIFKTSKNQPIKFRGFKFIGYHIDYPNVCYYYKKLDRDNYELMECLLEGDKKPEIGAGTSVKIIDAFMSNYLEDRINKKTYENKNEFIKKVLDTTYYDFTEQQKIGMYNKFISKIPKEVKSHKRFKDYIQDGFEVLYCSNDEGPDRYMGIVNIVLVKEEHIKSEKMGIDRRFTIFKPLKYRTTMKYIKGESLTKYREEDIPEIVINNDLLI